MFAKRGVIEPGNAAESLLIEKITDPNPKDRMPPPESGHTLTPTTDRSAAPMDRRGREVGHALGVRAAEAAGAAAGRRRPRGCGTRSTSSSSRGSNAKG